MRLARIRKEEHRYLGLNAREDDGQVLALSDMRPMRFQALEGQNAVDLLTELVNLPGEPDSPQVAAFIAKIHSLYFGYVTSGGHKAERMRGQEVVRLRDLYRQFWQPRIDRLKASSFLEFLGPDPRALRNPNNWKPGSDAFPFSDYRKTALRIDWKTGRLSIVARGPIDCLTHAAFQNRNRLRVCAGAKCRKLFVASAPKESLCSTSCKLESVRFRKRKWWRGSRAKPER